MTGPLRGIARPFVAGPAAGVCIRTRLKALPEADASVLRLVGSHLGRLASADLAQRVRDGLEHDKESWANRKRELTVVSSARWAGSITKASHDQWGLARRAQPRPGGAGVGREGMLAVIALWEIRESIRDGGLQPPPLPRELAWIDDPDS